MLFQFLLICFMVSIVWNLFSGLGGMLPVNRQDPARVVRALSVRISLSLLLFGLLLLGWFMGWWQPHRLA